MSPAVTLALVDPDDLDTVVSALPLASGIGFRDPRSDIGSGSFTIPNTDPDLAAVLVGMLVNFAVLNEPAFTVVVETIRQVVLTEAEEIAQATTVSGLGHVVLFDEGVVYPARGVAAAGADAEEGDRAFDWTAPAAVYDDSGWDDAVSLGAYTAGDPFLGYPTEEWPDATAEFLTTTLYDTDGTPSGFIYFRKTFTLADPLYATIVAHGDDRIRVWIDGAKILTAENNGLAGTPSAQQAPKATVLLDAGDHVLAVELVNYWKEPGYPVDWGPSDGASITYTDNVTSFILAAFEQLGDGTLGDLIVHSDDTWKMTEYPAHPPGMTPTKIVRLFLEEAQARGALLAWTLDFTDTEDSAGTTITEDAAFSTKVGTNGTTLLKELAATYSDFRAVPGEFTLQMYIKDQMGDDTAIELTAPTDPDDPYSGNVYELAHTILA